MKSRAVVPTTFLFTALAATLAAAASADDPSKYGWLTRYRSTNGAVSDRHFIGLARATTPSFELHDGLMNARLVDRFVAGFGGPPEPVRIVDDRYLVLGACVPHDCGSKSLLWVDPVDDMTIGAVAAMNYENGAATPIVFSRSATCATLPAAFRAALAAWIATNRMKPSRIDFVGRDGKRDTGCPA